MDWSKVKNILIVLFTALNIFLLANIIDASKSYSVSKKTLNNTIKILQNNNVTLECKIPTYSKATGAPEYEENVLNRVLILEKLLGNIPLPSINATQDGNIIESGSKWIKFNVNRFEYGNSKPKEEIDINSVEDIVRKIKLLLKDTEIPLDDFSLDRPKLQYLSDGRVFVVLREKKGNFILFENNIRAIISEKGIESLELNYRKLVDIAQPREITPVYEILIRSYHKRDKTVITHIDFGFKMTRLDNETDSFVDVPVWRIVDWDGQSEFYRADNGERIE